MKVNYIHVVEITDEEKFAMYMKLKKADIVRMHIELEKHIAPSVHVVQPSMVWPPIDNHVTFSSTSTDVKPINMQH